MITRYLSFLIVGIFYIAQSTEAQSAEYVTLPSGSKEIFVDMAPGKETQKYFFNESGDMVDLRNFILSSQQAKFQRLGRYDVALADSIDKYKDTDTLNVKITFNSVFESAPADNRKYSLEEQNKAAVTGYNRGIYEIDRLLPANTTVTKIGVSDIKLRITKKVLESLKYSQNISSIEVPEFVPPPPPAVIYNINLADVFDYGNNDNGLQSNTNFWYGDYRGQNAKIGVLELNPLDHSDSLLYLSTVPVHVQTTAHPSDTAHSKHPTTVIGTIRHYYNGNAGGGADATSGIWYADSLNASSGKEPAYSWLDDVSGCYVISNSWGYLAYATNGQYWANRMSRFFDIKSASNNYRTNVIAAGNGADTGSTANQYCRNYSANDRWTAETCKECMWYTHNAILVGALNDNNRDPASFSSWKNDSTSLDEVPIVSAAGKNIAYPWGAVWSGTSFAAPAVTSLISCAISSVSGIASYPELIRAALMASYEGYTATGDSSYDQYWMDKKGGAGVPKGGQRVGAIISNWTNDDTIRLCCRAPGLCSGSRTFNFASGAGSGTEDTTVLQLNQVASRTFLIYLSWVSNPEGTVNVGDKWVVDDIDLYVNNDDYSIYYGSASSYNSTEAIKFYWNYTGNMDYLKIRARVYNHHTNKAVYLAVAVTVI